MRWFLRLMMPLLTAVCCLAAHAAPPETLALSDLGNRPERWPIRVTLKKTFEFNDGSSVRKGAAVRVMGFDGQDVTVDAGPKLRFKISHRDCDLLDAANQSWAALTPAQRAVDPASLISDASLWPVRVQSLTTVEFDNKPAISPGDELELLAVERDQVKLYSARTATLFQAPHSWTDVISRARERVLLAPEKRPSRIAAALRGKLVRADGRPDTASNSEDAKLYLLYYGASWCGPCRAFSPTLVRFVNAAMRQHPGLCVVMVSGDKEDGAMFEYMRSEKMPWPAVSKANAGKSPLLEEFSGRGIPQLVVVDRHGKVLANSYAGEQYLGPNHTLGELGKLLESGVAR